LSKKKTNYPLIKKILYYIKINKKCHEIIFLLQYNRNLTLFIKKIKTNHNSTKDILNLKWHSGENVKKRIYMHLKKKGKILWSRSNRVDKKKKSNKWRIKLMIEYSLGAYVEFPHRDVNMSTPPIMLNSMCFWLITHNWESSSF